MEIKSAPDRALKYLGITADQKGKNTIFVGAAAGVLTGFVPRMIFDKPSFATTVLCGIAVGLTVGLAIRSVSHLLARRKSRGARS
jgi:hypothetical protein